MPPARAQSATDVRRGTGSPPARPGGAYLHDCPDCLRVRDAAEFLQEGGIKTNVSPDLFAVEFGFARTFNVIGVFAHWDRIVTPHETMSASLELTIMATGITLIK